jgi:hypothetical protein
MSLLCVFVVSMMTAAGNLTAPGYGGSGGGGGGRGGGGRGGGDGGGGGGGCGGGAAHKTDKIKVKTAFYGLPGSWNSYQLIKFYKRNCRANTNYKLTLLNLSGCNLLNNQMKKIAPYCSHLTELNLTCCNVTDAGLAKIAAGCPQLASLNISYCNAVTDAGLEIIAEMCPNLTWLDLSYCENVKGVGLDKIYSGCPKLDSSINLTGCKNVMKRAVDKELKKALKKAP